MARVIAFYLYATNLKGVSSMKLHRELGIRLEKAGIMAWISSMSVPELGGPDATPTERTRAPD